MKQSLIRINLFLYNFVVLFWTRIVLLRSWIDNWNWVNLKFTHNVVLAHQKFLKEKVVIYQYYISNDNLTQLYFVCNTMQLHLYFTA